MAKGRTGGEATTLVLKSKETGQCPNGVSESESERARTVTQDKMFRCEHDDGQRCSGTNAMGDRVFGVRTQRILVI